MASLQAPHAPRWHSSWQVCSGFPHFKSLPQTLVQMCSASKSSVVPRDTFCFRFAAMRSVAGFSPGQQCSPHSCRPQLRAILQILMHCGGCSIPWWQIVDDVVRPHRQTMGTTLRQGMHSPSWHFCWHSCPQASCFKHSFWQCGMGSSQELLVQSRSFKVLFPQGQWVTESGDSGQCGTSAVCSWQLFSQKWRPQS